MSCWPNYVAQHGEAAQQELLGALERDLVAALKVGQAFFLLRFCFFCSFSFVKELLGALKRKLVAALKIGDASPFFFYFFAGGGQGPAMLGRLLAYPLHMCASCACLAAT